MRLAPLSSDVKVSKALDYLAANLQSEVRVSELAKYCGISISYFAERFRRETGVSPHAMLVSLRVKRGKELLEATNLGLKEIAGALGFKTPSAFGRVFFRACGVTPNNYRRAASQRGQASSSV